MGLALSFLHHVLVAQRRRPGWLAEFGDIRTGDEGTAIAQKRDGTDRDVSVGAGYAVADARAHGMAERVHRRRVDSQDSDLTVGFVADNIVHGGLRLLGGVLSASVRRFKRADIRRLIACAGTANRVGVRKLTTPGFARVYIRITGDWPDRDLKEAEMYLVLILTKAPRIRDGLSRLAWSGTAFVLGLAVVGGAALLA